MKQQEERNCPSSYADTRKRRIVETFAAKPLVPPVAEVEKPEIKKDTERGHSLDDKTAKPVADVLRKLTG